MDGWMDGSIHQSGAFPRWCCHKSSSALTSRKKAQSRSCLFKNPIKFTRNDPKKDWLKRRSYTKFIFLGTLVFWKKCLQVCIEQGQTHSTSLSLLSFAVLFNIGFAPFGQARYHDVLCSCVELHMSNGKIWKETNAPCSRNISVGVFSGKAC